MLRLDAAHPPVWRDESTLQFGRDAVLVLPDPEPWQEMLLHALATGISAADAAAIAGGYGVPADRTYAFLDRLRPVLAPPPADRIRVLLDVAETLPHPVAADAAQLLSSSFELVRTAAPGTIAVLLAPHAVHPVRAQRLVSEGIAHLPVVFTGEEATVGPLLVPGHGPCLGCTAAYRRDADPAWPAVAAQLLSRPAAPVPPGFLAETLGLVERILTGRADSRARSHAVTISARTLHRRWDVRDVHPDCGCRSLAGSEIAGGSSVRTVPPTTATAFARPA